MRENRDSAGKRRTRESETQVGQEKTAIPTLFWPCDAVN